MSTLQSAKHDAPRISSRRSCRKVISTVSLHKTLSFWLAMLSPDSIFFSWLIFSDRSRSLPPNQRETGASLCHGKGRWIKISMDTMKNSSALQRCLWSFKHLQAHQWISRSNNFCAYQFATPLFPTYTSCSKLLWIFLRHLRITQVASAAWSYSRLGPDKLLRSSDSCQRRRGDFICRPEVSIG